MLKNPRRGYQKPFVVIVIILDHRIGHYVKPNIITFKYDNFLKNANLDVHVKVFNSIVKANEKTFEEYVIVSLYAMRYNIKLVPQLYVKISWMYFFGDYTCILQTSSKDS